MRIRRENMVEEPAFDLTPMIDVVMLLIVFFMLTAQFAATMRSPLDLPREAGEKLAEPRDSVVIEIDLNGQYKLEGDGVSSERLMQIVASDIRRLGSVERLEVIVRADRSSPAVHLNRLATDLSKLGVNRWTVSTTGQGGGA